MKMLIFALHFNWTLESSCSVFNRGQNAYHMQQPTN